MRTLGNLIGRVLLQSLHHQALAGVCTNKHINAPKHESGRAERKLRDYLLDIRSVFVLVGLKGKQTGFGKQRGRGQGRGHNSYAQGKHILYTSESHTHTTQNKSIIQPTSSGAALDTLTQTVYTLRQLRKTQIK